MKKSLLLIIGLCLFVGCSEGDADPDLKVKERASEFAEAYFNYDFERVQKLITADSQKWLQFAASNISQADMDLLNSQQTSVTVEVESCEYVNDSTSLVTVSVRDFMQKDSIGQAGVMTDEGLFRLTLVEQDGKHYVRMEGLPRSEKQSRD